MSAPKCFGIFSVDESDVHFGLTQWLTPQADALVVVAKYRASRCCITGLTAIVER
jgi:hypothetical protein